MYTEERSTTGSFFFYLLGAAACVGIGMLLAPQSGQETREQLKDWLRRRREEASQIGEDIEESVRSS